MAPEEFQESQRCGVPGIFLLPSLILATRTNWFLTARDPLNRACFGRDKKLVITVTES